MEEKRKDLKNTVLQFLKFNVVGVMNTLVDMGVFWLLTGLAGLADTPAQIISYACGVANSYLFNTLWTFRAQRKRNAREVFLFLLVNLVSLGVSLGVLYLSEHWLLIETPMLRKLIAVPCSLAVNFIGNKLLVFNSGEKEAARKEDGES